jgi:hypothetical protein
MRYDNLSMTGACATTCYDNLVLKTCFHIHLVPLHPGCIPPMMALIKHGPASSLTDIVVHTITSLAVGNELCDPVITNSGPLPYLGRG